MTIEQAAPEVSGPPTRSTADVLSGVIRFTLAKTPYALPVLTIRQNEEWREGLEEGLQPLLDETNDLDEAIAHISAFSDRLLDLVYSYDLTGRLPERGDWEKDIYPYEALRAVMEVRLAADPTLSFAVAALSQEIVEQQRSTPRSTSGSSSPSSTGGRSRKRASR